MNCLECLVKIFLMIGLAAIINPSIFFQLLTTGLLVLILMELIEIKRE